MDKVILEKDRKMIIFRRRRGHEGQQRQADRAGEQEGLESSKNRGEAVDGGYSA